MPIPADTFVLLRCFRCGEWERMHWREGYYVGFKDMGFPYMRAAYKFTCSVCGHRFDSYSARDRKER